MDAGASFFRTCFLVIFSVLLFVVYLVLRKRKDKTCCRIKRLSLATIAAIVIVFGILRPFVFGMYIVPSRSMMPTIHQGDRVFTNRVYYKFSDLRYGDVIVFKAPPRTEPESEDEVYVKRVIGLPGDKICVADGVVYRNDQPLDEKYIAEPPAYSLEPVEVQPGYVFVLGDNRNDSYDSSQWGPLEVEYVRGRATFIFWPRSRMGYIR